ncbi:MAG: hypothetical protein ACRC57_06540 [Sarcina sp.]
MAALFKDLIKPMYSIGKETFSIKFDSIDSNSYNAKNFSNAVISYLTSIGKSCEDSGKKYGNFPLLSIDGKNYLLERRLITTESKYLSEVAVLIEK